jgi:2-aminoadipate transaminase
MSVGNSLSRRAELAGGQPIGDWMRVALARPDLISLAAGFVDQATLPVDETQQALAALLADKERARAALQYGTNAGYLPLREQVLARLLAADGGKLAPAPPVEQVVLTAGSNQLLHLVGEVLFDPGDFALCAAPSYFVYLGLLAGLGVNSVGVAIDDEGMIPEALEEELHRRQRAGELSRVKVIYLTSYFDNPSTVTLSLERRAAIVEIAKRWSRGSKIYVIDDAAYRELRYAGDDLPSLRSFDPEGDTVIVAETFSKSFSPGVRVGWGVLPPALLEPVLAQKANIDFGSPNFNQYLMAEVLGQGLLTAHVDTIRATLGEKLEVTLAALDEHLGDVEGVEWQRPNGGLYVWLRLPEGMDAGPDGELLQHAMDEGVLYVPGEYCYPALGEPRRKNTIRLSFGVPTLAQLRVGVAALARAIGRAGAASRGGAARTLVDRLR